MLLNTGLLIYKSTHVWRQKPEDTVIPDHSRRVYPFKIYKINIKILIHNDKNRAVEHILQTSRPSPVTTDVNGGTVGIKTAEHNTPPVPLLFVYFLFTLPNLPQSHEHWSALLLPSSVVEFCLLIVPRHGRCGLLLSNPLFLSPFFFSFFAKAACPAAGACIRKRVGECSERETKLSKRRLCSILYCMIFVFRVIHACMSLLLRCEYPPELRKAAAKTAACACTSPCVLFVFVFLGHCASLFIKSSSTFISVHTIENQRIRCRVRFIVYFYSYINPETRGYCVPGP